MLNINNKFEIGQEVYLLQKKKCRICNGNGLCELVVALFLRIVGDDLDKTEGNVVLGGDMSDSTSLHLDGAAPGAGDDVLLDGGVRDELISGGENAFRVNDAHLL